ncbi:MAG: glycosyltransferase family 2 protein [Gemmobacter sp.]
MTPPLHRLTAAVTRRLGLLRDTLALRRAFRHLHGPAQVILAPDEVALVALVKDAAWFLGPFLAHHQALGVAHVVLIDNGSTDATVDIARGFGRVTVLRNPLPAKRHEVALRAMGARRVLRGGWVLFADADEMAELPLGDLATLARYANDQGHTAVLGQMIDLFAPGPYADHAGLDYRAAIDACRLWSVRGLERIAYHDAARVDFHWFLRGNTCDDPGVTFLQGGLRAEVFGETPFLSKHSMVRNVAGVDLMTHPHAASRVQVSDVTLALRHYKLAGDWRARDRASVAAATWDHAEDARRLLAAGDDRFVIAPAEPLEWRGAGDVLDRGVLYASGRARGVLGG